MVELDNRKLLAYEGYNKKYKYYSVPEDKNHPTVVKTHLFHIFQRHE